MKAQKDGATGNWKIQYRVKDTFGNVKKSTKRGFSTKRAAEEWLRNYLITQQADLNMTLADYVQLYYEDVGLRLREHTMRTKKYIIDLKIIPVLGNLKMNEIKPIHIRKWQNGLISQGYSQTYLRCIQNQLTAMFSHAVKYYELKSNPCSKCDPLGRNKADEMEFWTKEEFTKFIDAVMDKRISYAAFMTLYYTGIRIGELMALTKSDIDIHKKTISITKSYQRLGNRDVITEPKTPKSKRVVSIPGFLSEIIDDFIKSSFGLSDYDRLFPITKGYLTNEMKRGIRLSGVKKIRTHSIRHSHSAHLVELNFPILEIGQRLGHSSLNSTMVYAHLYPNKQENIANKLGEEFSEDILCQD